MPRKPLSRLGILGGTFDPPHLGHLAVATATRTALGLDRVVLVPAHDPWQKTAAGFVPSPAGVRLEMVSALVADTEGLGVDDREIRRGGVSYTLDTVREILDSAPGTEIFLILGADAARGFATWRGHDELARLSTLVIVNRPSATTVVPEGAPGAETIVIEGIDISSTAVREAVGRGEDVSGLVGDRVAAVIARHGLYGATR